MAANETRGLRSSSVRRAEGFQPSAPVLARLPRYAKRSRVPTGRCLLLAAHLDAAFDAALITFDDEGAVLDVAAGSRSQRGNC